MQKSALKVGKSRELGKSPFFWGGKKGGKILTGKKTKPGTWKPGLKPEEEVGGLSVS